jgi:hypothetical protein
VPLLAPVADKLWHRPDLVRRAAGHQHADVASCTRRSASRCSTCARSRPKEAYVDKVTGKLMEPVTTGQIYWGAVPFVVIQVLMVAIALMFPQMIMRYKGEPSTAPTIELQAPSGGGLSAPAQPGLPPLGLPGGAPALPGQAAPAIPGQAAPAAPAVDLSQPPKIN